jgi:hypothetical protein
MACGAILRGVLLPMASEASAHRMGYGVLCNRCFGHVSVAGGTGNAGLIMRGMTKFYMSFGRELIHAHPGDLKVVPGVSNHFLNFRLFFAEFGVTEHAFSNRGDTGGSAIVSADVTVEAGKAQTHVRVVRKRDWLLCRTPDGEQRKKARTLPAELKSLPRSPTTQNCIFSCPLLSLRGTLSVCNMTPARVGSCYF